MFCIEGDFNIYCKKILGSPQEVFTYVSEVTINHDRMVQLY